MKAVLIRIGKAIMLAIGENLVTVPVAAAVVGRLHLNYTAPALSWALNNLPFYLVMWAREARQERDRRCWRRYLGYA